MKKAIAAILLLCLTVLLFACSENGKKAKTDAPGYSGQTEHVEYVAQPLSYDANARVVPGDYHALHFPSGMGKALTYTKNGATDKTVTLFGQKYLLNYRQTIIPAGGYYEIDSYVTYKKHVLIRPDTGKVVSFDTVPSYAKDYVSPVREGATEEEYLAYAKSILNDVAGVPTDGWEATVRITSTKYANERGYFVLRNGTVLSLAEEDYEATVGSRVSVTFTKKIGEFKRFDEMKVEMTGAGEVISFNAINYDEAFAPFVCVTPDRARIERAVSPLVSSYAHGLDSHVEKIVMYVDDGTLWAQVFILITGPEGASAGVTFSVEVAKIAE